MTVSQRRAFETLWGRYGLDLEAGLCDFDRLFERQAPRVLEIGFGMGQSLLAMAQRHPKADYLGLEVYRPGVGALLTQLRDQGLTNVRVGCADAVVVLKDHVPDASLDRVQIFFPDPWPKKRHHKRRLIQTEFVALLRDKLKPGGCLHLATDWEPYAQHMLSVMEGAVGFVNQSTQGNYSPRPPWRPVTKFEKRGKGLGHGVWDLIWSVKTE